MKKWIIILLLTTIAQIACAQTYIPETTTYTTKEGLSSNEIYAIHKDTRGFMWIGTQYGLNRFDGREFKIYTRENGSGLDFNIIHKIMEDESGNLWLVKTNEKYEHSFTAVEISLFNINSGIVMSFEEYFGEDVPFTTEDITFIEQLDDESVFIHCSKTKKAFTYHSSTGFQTIPFPKDIEYVQSALLKKNGNLLITGFKERLLNIFFEINTKGEIIQEDFSTMLWTIYDQERSYHLATWGNLNLEAFDYFSPKFEMSLPDQPVNSSILQTNYNPYQQLFWLRKRGIILVVKPDGQIVYQHENVDENLGEIPVLFDGTTTWFSNRKNGLVSVSLKPDHFRTFRFFETPIDNSMRGIVRDNTGMLWFSTIYGMGRMDSEDHISIINTNKYFSPFLEDRKGNIWYFDKYDDNLVRFDAINKRRTSFPVKMNYLPWSLFEADNGDIWIDTGHNGFHALNPKTAEIFSKSTFRRNEKTSFKIYHFQKRDEHSVWVCSSQGLFIVDWDGEILAEFNDEKTNEFYLPAEDIHHLYQSDKDVIWVATGDAGLFELRINDIPADEAGYQHARLPESSTIENQYTTENGLSSNALHAVYADDFDYLWISSDNGLMQLDRQNRQISKYFQSNGLAQNEFNRIAHYQDDNGKLYFGGLHGLTVFDPGDFSDSRDEKQAPVLTIASYEQFSGEKKKFENLTAALLESSQIVLHPNDRFFKMKLALLDFEDGKNNIYHYRIKNLYDWQSTTNNELSISSLPYGSHLLEIKAQNGNLQNSANILSIEVSVLRPFYLKWWFLLLSLMVFGVIIWLFFKRRTQQLLIRQEADQLKKLDKMKSRFFANISHELRTPLTLIGLPLEQLLENLEQFSETEIRQYIQAAYSGKENLNHLVNEILDLSRLEAGKLTLEVKPIALSDFLKRAVGVFDSGAAAKGIDFQFSCNIPEDLKILSDHTKLEMVINNLLSNALKFTPAGGEIIVSATWRNSKELYFKVQDNGRGIHIDDLPRVFERYFQSGQQNAKLEGGSGIGLAICKEFVELMGGKIQVDSELGMGSTFSFRIPFKTTTKAVSFPPELGINNTPLFLTEDPEPTFSKEKRTILIVEDHSELRRHLKNILSPKYNILMASNGEEAIQRLSSADCHLILSDVMMPKMDGFALLEKVKAHDQFCGTPFILLTARADIEDKLQGLRIGVDAYMTKPFEIEELLLRVNNLLANARNRNEYETEGATEIKKEKEPAARTTVYQPSREDIDWLQQVESIALREIRSKQFMMEDIATELFISYSSFRRRIKQITGLPPNRYIRSIRLHKAKRILETQSVRTLKEVAFEVGFDGLTHFRKLFEAEFGRNPQDFLK